MSKLLNKIKNAALWVYQAPQNIVGLITYNCYKGYEICTKETCGENIKCKLSNNISGGVTIGNYIILNNTKYLNHELGHTRQSKILGPLYLPVIALPSLLHAGVFSSFDCRGNANKRYFDFYTEYWLFPKDSLQEYQKNK